MGVLRKHVALVVGISFALVTIGAAAFASSNRSGAINTFDGADAIAFQCSSSTTFLNMPSMVVTFDQGTADSSVVVMFHGYLTLDTAAGPETLGIIRLRIDGVEQGPGEVPVLFEDDRGAEGFNWETTALSAGSHTARVQWRNNLGSNFCVGARSLIILHT